MYRSTDERLRPQEWLLKLDEDGQRYFELLAEDNSLAIAAYRLARARCRVQPIPSAIPTRRELEAAARRLLSYTGGVPYLPSHLAAECEHRGFPVIDVA